MRFVFEGCVLDSSRRELHRDGKMIHVEPQVFDLLIHLLENSNRVLSKDDLLNAVWQGRIVSESTLSSRINAARRAIGDSGQRQSLIRTVPRKGIRFVGDVQQDQVETDGADTRLSVNGQAASETSKSPSQKVTFSRTTDDVNLAVAAVGDGPPVVKTANWLNHIEYDWHSPVWSPMLRQLAARFHLVRYDERGTGLSDWNVGEISLDAFVRDLETVVDELGLERFVLLGISQGAAVSIAYAARHPDRVSRLVISGGYPLGWRKRGNAEEIALREALITLVRHGWGHDNPAYRQTFTSRLMPDATSEQMQSFNELERISTSPENAVRLMDVFGDIDVTDLLSQVKARTLVLHSRNDASIPLEQGLYLARAIPNARFRAIESRNHLILSHEPMWRHYMDEVCAFLEQDGPQS